MIETLITKFTSVWKKYLAVNNPVKEQNSVPHNEAPQKPQSSQKKPQENNEQENSSFTLTVVFAFFLFLVFFSFLASFSGALIFFQEVPHDEPFKPSQLFFPKHENNYYVKPTISTKLLSAELPAAFVNELQKILIVHQSESEFDSAVSKLLKDNKPVLSSQWLLTAPFHNLSQDIEDFILNGTDNRSKAEIISSVQSFLEKASQQYKQALSIFCQEIGFSKNWLRQNECVEQHIGLEYLSLRLENKINKENLSEVQQFLLNTAHAKISKVILYALTDVAEQPIGMDMWWDFMIDIFFAFAIAITAAIAIGVPLQLMRHEKHRTPGKIMFFILIVIPLGLLFSGVSNYVLIWVYSNHAQYIDNIQENTQNQLREWLNDTQKKFNELHSKHERISNREEELSINKTKSHLDWLEGTYKNYVQTIRAFDIRNRKLTTQEAIETIEKQQEYFDFNRKDDYSYKHVNDINDSQEYFDKVETEINGGAGSYGKKGYGPNAQQQLIYMGIAIHRMTSSLCEQIKTDLNSLNSFIRDFNVELSTKITLKPCFKEQRWQSLWNNKNSEKYPQGQREINYYASKFLGELLPKYDRLLTNTQYNWTFLKEGFNKFHDAENILGNQRAVLTELKGLIETHEKNVSTLIEQTETQEPNEVGEQLIKGSVPLFKQQKIIYDKAKHLSIDVKTPQKKIEMPLHEVIRNRLYVIFFSTYHIPSQHYEMLINSITEQNDEQNIAEVFENIENKIFFSEKDLISEVENRLNSKLPVDIYSYLRGVIDLSKNELIFNDKLLPKQFSELSYVLNAVIVDDTDIFELTNLLTTQLSRPLSVQESLLINGAIEKREYDFEKDLFPFFLSAIPDIATIILGLLMIFVNLEKSTTLTEIGNHIVSLVKKIVSLVKKPFLSQSEKEEEQNKEEGKKIEIQKERCDQQIELNDIYKKFMSKNQDFRKMFKEELKAIKEFSIELEVLHSSLETNSEKLKQAFKVLENERFKTNLEAHLIEIEKLRLAKKNMRENAADVLHDFERHFRDMLDSAAALANEEILNKHLTETEQNMLRAKYNHISFYAEQLKEILNDKESRI